MDSISERLATLENRIKASESLSAALYERVLELERKMQERQPATPTPAPVLRPPRAEYTMSKSALPELPANLVPYYTFMHGVPANTAKRLLDAAGVNIIRGHWIAGEHHFDKALDATGQRQAYEALHKHPRFQPCDACPHG